MSERSPSIRKQMLSRIQSQGRGWVFTPSSFEDLCGRSAISTNLQRLREAGTIRQLSRGLYDYPVIHDKLGALAPSVDAIAEALAGREGIRLQPTGAYAANMLGLSTQVPMKVMFLTDGPSRTVKVGNQEIVLKQTSPKNMATAGRISGLVIQALRHLGRKHVDDTTLKKLVDRLDQEALNQLKADIRFAPGWIADLIRTLHDRQESGS
jgi:hypothetical protein